MDRIIWARDVKINESNTRYVEEPYGASEQPEGTPIASTDAQTTPIASIEAEMAQNAHGNRDDETNASGLSSETAQAVSRPEPDEDPQRASYMD